MQDAKNSIIDVPVAARATIKDVAFAAGVSISTASKALNERGRMAAETRERIQSVAQQLISPERDGASFGRAALIYAWAADQ